MENFILYNVIAVVVCICLFYLFARISDVVNNKKAQDIIVILGVATVVCGCVLALNLLGLIVNQF